MPESVTWNGLTAVYAQDELALMADLKAGVGAGEVDRRELEVFHELKSRLGAVLRLLESDPAGGTVYAVGKGSKWDATRNTSHPGGVAPSALADAQAALEAYRNEERAPQRRHEALEGQGSFFNLPRQRP